MSVHRSQCGWTGEYFQAGGKDLCCNAAKPTVACSSGTGLSSGKADVPTAKSVALIADADVYFRMAVGAILRRELGFSDVVEVPTFDEANEYLLVHPEVSVAILDLSTPGMKAAMGLRIIRASFPKIKLAVTSISTSRCDILSALEAGVHGYVPKNLSVAGLTSALRLVLDGGLYVPPILAEVAPQIPESTIKLTDMRVFSDAPARGQLTPRQKDVLELLVQGKPNKEIASALNLGEGTVKIHLAAIFRYFGVNNRAAAAVASARPHPSREFSVLGRTAKAGPTPSESAGMIPAQ
jgi:DNA-binding NarL/FixJ family response regulator